MLKEIQPKRKNKKVGVSNRQAVESRSSNQRNGVFAGETVRESPYS